MSPEELDQWRGREARRLRRECPEEATEVIAARLAREGWTPPKPEPVDPDLLAFREWLATSPLTPRPAGDPNRYGDVLCETFLAGARMAREQERERANHPIAFAVRVMAGVFKDLDHAKREAREALARISERA